MRLSRVRNVVKRNGGEGVVECRESLCEQYKIKGRSEKKRHAALETQQEGGGWKRRGNRYTVKIKEIK